MAVNMRDTLPWSTGQRTVMLLVAFSVCITMSGVFVGHIALREAILNMNDTYLCTEQRSLTGQTDCFVKESLLNGVYYSAIILHQLLQYPIGKATDRFGPRIVCMFGCFAFAIGVLVLAGSDLRLSLAHHVGYYIMALAGACIFVPSLQLCRIFPRFSKVLMGLMSCAFDVSAIVFSLLDHLQFIIPPSWSNRPLNFLLLIYVIIPILSFLLVTSFYPDQKLPFPVKALTEGTNKEQNVRSRSVSHILCSWDFWLLAIFNAFMSKKFSIFIATLPMQLGRFGLSWKFQRQVLRDFTTLFALGGLVSMSSTAIMLESFSLWLNLSFLFTFLILWGPLFEMGTELSVSIAVLLGCLIRPYYFALINSYCERLFGHALLGEIYSCVLILSGLSHIYSCGFVYHSWTDEGLFFMTILRITQNGAYLGFILPLYLFLKKI